MISSAIILPILPAPALVPPGIPGTVGWVLLGPPEMSRNFKVREKLANFLHRATVLRLWVAAGPSEQVLLTVPPTAECLQMDEKLWLALSCAGSQMSLCASRDRRGPNSFRIWLFSFRIEHLVLPLVQSCTAWPCQTLAQTGPSPNMFVLWFVWRTCQCKFHSIWDKPKGADDCR